MEHSKHRKASALFAAACLGSTSSFQPNCRRIGLRTAKSNIKVEVRGCGVFLRSSLQEEEDTKLLRDLVGSETISEAIVKGSVDSANLQSRTFDGRGFMESLKGKMGTVSKERLINPDSYDNANSARLFSNVQYVTKDGPDDQENKDALLVLRAEGSTWGAAALVAGTTVGAGILALPAATVSSGFLPSTGGLVIAWIYMTMSGLLLAELSINRIAETGRPGLGILDLYRTYLGPWGKYIGSLAYFFLHYVVMTAYISQGGSNLSGFINGLPVDADLTAQNSQVLFAIATGLPLFLAQDKLVERVNNILVVGVFGSFLGLVACGLPSMNVPELLNPIHSHPENVLSAAPILFLSLVYQNIVPTVVTQLEGDRKKITSAIVLGTLGPLLMFVLWNAIILGNVYNGLASEASLASGNIDPVLLLQGTATEMGNSNTFSNLVSTFSELAVVTSVIGFVYGLVNAWTDVLNVSPSDEDYGNIWKPILFSATLLPPLVLSLGNPDVFYSALDYGGAFGVSTLFLFLPPLMAWKNRYSDESKPLGTLPLVPGGKLSLGSLYKVSATLILEQGAEKLGVFDFFKDQWNNGYLLDIHVHFNQLRDLVLG